MSDVESNLIRLEEVIETRSDQGPVRRSFKRMKTEDPHPDQPAVSERPTVRLLQPLTLD